MFSHSVGTAYAPLLSASSMGMGPLPASKGRRRQAKALLKSFFHRKDSGCRYEQPAFCGTGDTSSPHRRVRDRIRTAFQSWFPPKKCRLNSLNPSSTSRLLETANYSTAQGDYSPCSLSSSIATGCETDAGTWNQVRFCTQPTYASAPRYDEYSSSFILPADYSSFANEVLSVRIRVKDISISKLESIAEANEPDKYHKSDKYNESDETCVESCDSLSLPDSACLSCCEPRYYTANLDLNNSSSSSHFAGSFQESLPLKKIRKCPTPSLINASDSASVDSINPSYTAAMVSGSTAIDPELPLIAYFSLPEAEIFSEGWKESNVVVEISSAATDMWDDLNAFQNQRMKDDQNEEPKWAQQDYGDASEFQFGNYKCQQSFAKEFKKNVAEELANTTYSMMQAVDGVDRSKYIVDDEEFLENIYTESYFANLQN